MFKIFTVSSGKVTEGATIQPFSFQNGEITIASIIIGEEGRGRKLGVLPVAGQVPEKSYVLYAAGIGTTRSNKPRLIPTQKIENTDHAIIVFRTKIGYRGANNHTGDRVGTKEDGTPTGFEPFPGTILSQGVIAQGHAGRMGHGNQFVVLMPKGVIFRTTYFGRLYGSPSSHYYVFNGENIISMTWDERLLLSVDMLDL